MLTFVDVLTFVVPTTPNLQGLMGTFYIVDQMGLIWH